MAGPVRFVHAADLHLDAPFKGVDASDPRVRDALAASTYRALDRLVEICLEHEAHFLVLAGDVYNQAEKQLRAEFAFRAACERLAEAGIEVFVARGNHDPANGFSAGLAMPETVHFFSEREVERIPFVQDGQELCALYGRSFRTPAETENLALGYKRSKGDRLAIGVLHANAGSHAGYEPYAPCTLDDLRSAHMDYWALGHIHKPEVLETSPEIAYAGCTQGLDPSESGLRGCRVVTLGPDGSTSIFVPTSAVVWERATIDATELETIDDVLGALESAVARIALAAEGLPVVVRFELEGRSGVHAPLARPGALADIRAELAASSLGCEPWVWVDRITDRTRSVLDLDAVRAGQDLAGDLVRVADALAGDGAGLAEFFAASAQPVLARLDARDVPELDAASLLERARDLALDRLLAGEER